MADTTYNGWSNYETWAVKLWIDNEEGSDNYWREVSQEVWNEATADVPLTREDVARSTLADRLKDEHDEAMPEVQGVFADLLNAALGSVDWYEIAGSMLEDVDKTATETADAE